MFFAHAVNGRFQPTLPARGATRLAACRVSGSTISTHAPRTGSDTTNCIVEISTTHFNPRSPHGERRHAARLYDGAVRFQSTLPARGATLVVGGASKLVAVFQSTLPARGATPHPSASNATECISIHAPRTGSDDLLATSVESLAIFQSTLPARGATGSKRMSTRKQFLFQSTLPARGATRDWPHCPICWKFQSTLPARGATPRFLLFG